jgi:hypothetical protein
MRYFLFVLLFIFSTQGFTGQVDGKGLDCIIKNSKETYSEMFWFNNDRWHAVLYWEAVDAIYPDEVLDKNAKRYFTTQDTLIFDNEIVSNKLDRNTLKLKRYNKLLDIDEVGSCKVFVGFDSVKKRQAELINANKKSRSKNKI